MGSEIHLTYLSPHCLQGDLLKRANHHSLSIMRSSDVSNTYWGINRRLANQTQGDELSFIMKGSQTKVTLAPADQIYSDDKNLIIRASHFRVQSDSQTCFGAKE